MVAHKLLLSLILVLLHTYIYYTYNAHIRTSNTNGTFTFPNYFYKQSSTSRTTRYIFYSFEVKTEYLNNFTITLSNLIINSTIIGCYYDFRGVSVLLRRIGEGGVIPIDMVRWITCDCDKFSSQQYCLKDIHDESIERCVVSGNSSLTCHVLSLGFRIYFDIYDEIDDNGNFVMDYTSRNATPTDICDAMYMNYQNRSAEDVTISLSDTYLPTTNCVWMLPQIHSDIFQFVLIEVHHLSIANCVNGKLQIWDINNSTDKALKTLCGSRNAFTISLNNVSGGIRVTFVTNKQISVRFKLVIQTRQRHDIILRQQIDIKDLSQYNISLHDLFKKFPMCPKPSRSSNCQYVVTFVGEYGFRISVVLSDNIGTVTAFDGPSVDNRHLRYGEKNSQYEEFEDIGFLSVGPYLTMSLNMSTVNASSLIYYHKRLAFPRSSLYHRLFNCNTSELHMTKLGIFNLNSILNVMINRKKLEANSYACYIVMTVSTYLVVSLKITDMEYDQIGGGCDTHGIVMYGGSVVSRNKLGPFCETEKGYMKALFNPLVTTSNQVYIMIYMYAQAGDWYQHINVEITATPCSSIHIMPRVLNKQHTLATADVQIEKTINNGKILMNITYSNKRATCMSLVFHPDKHNDIYQYTISINGINNARLSQHEYVWKSPFHQTDKRIIRYTLNKLNMSQITNIITFLTASYTSLRLVKFYMGHNEKRTPQLLDTCSYKDPQDIHNNHIPVFRGFIDLFDSRTRTSCYITLSSGSKSAQTDMISHYFELYIHVYYGYYDHELTITEYGHKTVYEEHKLTHKTFASISTELLILDLRTADVSIEYQHMTYQPIQHKQLFQYNGHSYQIFRFRWKETPKTVQNKCVLYRGNLISVSTLGELETIKTATATLWKSVIGGDTNSWAIKIIIGLNKTMQKDKTTQWRWTDGSPLTISDWYYPDMFTHYIPHKYQIQGKQFKTPEPEDHPRYLCGMMQIYHPRQSTNWRSIDCNKVPESGYVYYICEYPRDIASQEQLMKSITNNRDVKCPHNTGNCGGNNSNTVIDHRNLFKYVQLSISDMCPTNWTFIKGKCWLLVTALLGDNTTTHECDKYGGKLAKIDSLEIVRRYLIYVQHHESHGSIWVMSRGKRSCVQYRPRVDLMETEDERLEIVEASECVRTVLIDNYNYYTAQYYPTSCPIGERSYRKTSDIEMKNVTCAPNHVFCERHIVSVNKTCEVGYLPCADMSCVSPDLVCDGVDDCKSGEDEQGCELPDYWYNCSTGQENITISKYCDFHRDCSDGSDEEGCVYPLCSDGQFMCANYQCVDETKHCNGMKDSCVDFSDEADCKSDEKCINGFYCKDESCVPEGYKNDGKIDCRSSLDEPYMSDYLKLKGEPHDIRNCTSIESRCSEINVGCFNRGEACVLGYDTNGRMKSCANGAHLNNCSSFECPGRFKCPNSYCIDMKRVCNGIQDCQNKEDEAECDGTRSPGLYRCGGGQTYTIDRSQVCNGEFDCLHYQSDEKYCNMSECPKGCTCRGFYYNCEGNITHNASISIANFSVFARTINVANNVLGSLSMFQFSRYSVLAVLRLSHNHIKKIDNDTFAELHNLIILDLGNNFIKTLPSEVFAGLRNLITLDLSNNMLTTLGQNTFKDLSRLKYLPLHGNSIKILLSKTFDGLSQMSVLNLSMLHISKVMTGALYGLDNLKILDLSRNNMTHIDLGVFYPQQKLTRVILTGNSLTSVETDVFGDINAEFIETDAFRFCCFTNKTLCITCTPKSDSYSSCHDLMSNNFLRIAIWLIGWLAFIGNVIVIICRPILGIKTASEVCIFALSCSDLMTGIYLLILASVDAHYRGEYIFYDVKWRNSGLCQTCGILSTLSAQLSSFLLLLITLDRFIHLVFPMKAVSYSRRSAAAVCVAVFMVSFLESIIPIMSESYFGKWFYGKTALCLAYDFNDISDGWEYTLHSVAFRHIFGRNTKTHVLMYTFILYVNERHYVVVYKNAKNNKIVTHYKKLCPAKLDC